MQNRTFLTDVNNIFLRSFDIGKQQANLTGLRLKEMDCKFKRLVHSGLPRARETAELIQRHINAEIFEVDSLLEEGGPLPPSPTQTYWSLPDQVSTRHLTRVTSSSTLHYR